MTFFEEAITIGVCAAATILTRFLPFFVFSSRRPTPPFMTYLGKALPPAIFAMLCVYCLRPISPFLFRPTDCQNYVRQPSPFSCSSKSAA